jgi:hypothetical protein
VRTKLALIPVLLAANLLAGCAGLGRTGYVQSDIPGVAETLARWHAEHRDADCKPGTVAVNVDASVERATTSVGLTRERYEHSIVCVQP